MRVILAQPRGFCAGVVRAIAIVERALAKYGAPVYVRHEIVHNRHVVDALKAQGAIFIESLAEIPTGAVAIFSAHGVPSEVERDAERRGLAAIDATCPLVKKVHIEGRRYAAQGYEVVLIGHEGHPEVVGTLGQINGRVHLVATVDDVASLKVADPEHLAYVTQTTLSVDETRAVAEALQRRFPAIEGPDTKDICYATQNRHWRHASMPFWSWGLPTAPTRTACAKSRSIAACRAILWTMSMASIGAGSTRSKRSASRRVPQRPNRSSMR